MVWLTSPQRSSLRTLLDGLPNEAIDIHLHTLRESLRDSNAVSVHPSPMETQSYQGHNSAQTVRLLCFCFYFICPIYPL